MPTAIVDVYLDKETVLRYYQGILTRVKGNSRSGQPMDLPVDIFMKYVTHDGIFGTFEITYKDNGKFQDIRKIG